VCIESKLVGSHGVSDRQNRQHGFRGWLLVSISRRFSHGNRRHRHERLYGVSFGI